MSGPYDTEFYKLGRQLGRISGTLSVLGSSYIIQNVLRDPKKKQKFANHVVVALSFADLTASFFASILGQLPAPKGSAKGAIGNVGTCAAASFFFGTGFGASTYFNASLAIVYLLMIKYGWKEERLQKNRIHFLGIPLLLVLPFVIADISLGGGNFNGVFCENSAPLPDGCHSDPTTCTRGEKLAQAPLLLLFGMTLQSLISLPIVVGCMISLYLAVLKIEKRNDQYRFNGEVHREQSKLIAIQGIYYVWAFLLVEVTWVVVMVVFVTTEEKTDSVLKFFHAAYFLIPSQGFFNALVYLRPSYLEYLRKNPEKTIPNRIRRLFGLEIQLSQEPRHSNTKKNKNGLNNNTNSVTSSGDDPNYSSNFTKGTFQGSTRGSFHPSSPLELQEQGDESVMIVSINSTGMVPEKQHGEQEHLEEGLKARKGEDNNKNNEGKREDSIIKNDHTLSNSTPHSLLSVSSSSSSSSSSPASLPAVPRKATDFTGRIVEVDSVNSKSFDDDK